MGACTSTARHRKKHHRQLHRRTPTKNSPCLDNKQVSFPPSTVLPKAQSPRPQSLFTHFDTQSSPLIEPVVYKTATNSLIQLYSSNMNHSNNSNRNSWISSSSSSTSHIQSRIPAPKTRLPVYSTTVTGTPTGTIRPMALTNRPAISSASPSPAQPRLGFIPRPTAPGLQQAQAATLQARSRSISPASTASANSSFTQPASKTQATSHRLNANNAAKPKVLPSTSPRAHKDSPSAATDRPRTTLSSRVSNTPSLIASAPPPKTDINTVRDRYKAPKRMTFFARRTPITSAMKSSPIEPAVIEEEKNEQSSADEQTNSFPVESQNDDANTESAQQGDSAYASTESPTNRPMSFQCPQPIRRRTVSSLSTSSELSNALRREGLLDDDNCSLKSDDLICDYDDTLTLDSVSKTNRTDSDSSNSLSLDASKKSLTAVKPNASPMPSTSKDYRTTPTPSNLRESLDELTRLSHRMENTIEHDHHRLLTRSVSLKPPPTCLPPREDAEQITMDIEAYRQVMKDVMVVKTILHQLDRLLKHSDGANMTDSMIGSFHESMVVSRHHSLSGTGGESHLRTNSVDENSSYDDLAKELMLLRKEREQDKQTIKLLQEQMYKYSSQTNGS